MQQNSTSSDGVVVRKTRCAHRQPRSFNCQLRFRFILQSTSNRNATGPWRKFSRLDHGVSDDRDDTTTREECRPRCYTFFCFRWNLRELNKISYFAFNLSSRLISDKSIAASIYPTSLFLWDGQDLAIDACFDARVESDRKLGKCQKHVR